MVADTPTDEAPPLGNSPRLHIERSGAGPVTADRQLHLGPTPEIRKDRADQGATSVRSSALVLSAS